MSPERYVSIWVVIASVAIGASLGALLRWSITYLLNDKVWIVPAPMGTLVVNLLAGFLMGLALAWLSTHLSVPVYVRLFVITGFLGAFSTISAVVGENFQYVLEGRYLAACVHYLLHVGGCYLTMIAGYFCLHGKI